MPFYFRDYEAGIVKFEARRGWGNIISSYTYAESTGNNESGPRHYAYGDGDYFPVNFYNHEGNLGDHREHRFKINGFLTLPKRWIIGVDGYWSSPSHLTVNSTCTQFSAAPGRRSTADQMDALGIDPATIDYCTSPDGGNLGSYDIFHSERGALDTKSLYRLDLQVSKGFRVGSTEITGIFTILNVFGTELGTVFNSDAFRQDTMTDPETGFVEPLVYQDDDPNEPYYDEYYGADSSPVLIPVGEPTSFQQPRRYELGLRIEF
jgi:hypothetical protein